MRKMLMILGVVGWQVSLAAWNGMIYQFVNKGSQFVIATHSPIIMAYPDAEIFLLTEEGLKKTAYTDTEHYTVARQLLGNHR